MIIISILLSITPVLSYLDFFTSSMIADIQSCLSRAIPRNQTLCDNQIQTFFQAASVAISEIYSIYLPDAKQKISAPIFPGVNYGYLQLLSSSMCTPGSHPQRARMNFQFREGNNSWCAGSATSGEFIQASSSIPLQFYSVSTKGSPLQSVWISSYILQYSLDGYEWISYNNSFIFQGNTDNSLVVTNILTPFVARTVRLVPITWNLYICTKIEFNVSRIYFDPLPPRDNTQVYTKAILTGSNVVASSIYGPFCDVTKIALDFRTSSTCPGFCAGINDTNQWINIAAGSYVWWRRISIQGNPLDLLYQYTNLVSIAYTYDGIMWKDYNGGMTFTGAYDGWSVIAIDLVPFYALAVKIKLKGIVRWPCGRFEAYFTRT